MTPTPIFHGEIADSEDAELVLLDSERDQRRRHRQSLRGHRVEVIIRKIRTQRSLDQSNWIHLAATALAEHCGYTLAEMKLILMGECWGWHTVGGREMPVKIHTADMSTEEGTYFIEWLVPWANERFPECNITYPDPSKKKRGRRAA